MAPPSWGSRRTIQNFHLVWLDGSISKLNNDDYRNSIAKLRQVVDIIHIFTNVDECVDFIDSTKEQKTFMISSGVLGKTAVPVVHHKPQVCAIYIFCGKKARHKKWAKEWPKVEGVYTDITPICEALKHAIQDFDHNSVTISFVKPTDGALVDNLDAFDSFFMYTKILKEILLTIDYEQSHVNDFLTYCREQLASNSTELENLDKIEKANIRHQPIWWYTYNCFLSTMLNTALRSMDIDLIIKMGFFIRDLHEHIAALHSEQFRGHHRSYSFTVYRGQGVSQADFEKLMKTQGGLLAFTNFLSTSQKRDVSLEFIRQTIHNSNLIGVLFVMKIDPSITATPFANVENVGYYPGEKEILFAMHSIFRIGHVKQIDMNGRLWEVDLTLTGENDSQLHSLTESMREETSSVSKKWHQLGQLMIKLGQLSKAEELYHTLLKETTDEHEKVHFLQQLGWIKIEQGKYEEAVAFYETALDIEQKILPENHSDLASSFNHIGNVYKNIGAYSKALSSHEKALKIRQKILPANHFHLASSYNNIGLVYDNMGDYSKALWSHEKALEIRQKTLPANHPYLASSYNNIGLVYNNIGEYSKAISFHDKALKIRQKILPAKHPDLATSYNNIGGVYYNMGDYSKARSYFECVEDILQCSLPPNHPHLQSVRNSIEIVNDF